MRRGLLALLIVGIMICSGCKKEEESVVVKVNGAPITKQQVDEVVNRHMSSPFLAQFDKNSNEAKMLVLIATDKAVNELIVKEILNAEIAKRNITVSTDDLDEFKKKMIEEVGGEENFKALLEKNNVTENDFNTMIANDISVSKLIDTISPVFVSDAEVKKFYNDNKTSKFTYPDSVRASHILVKDKAKAENILKEAKVPNADFAALAKKYSEDPGSAQNGGDLGFFTKDQMVKPFADAAFSLKPDEISELVQSEFGYHIIKVVDRKKAGVMPFADMKAEIKKFLEDEKKVQALQKFIEAQKSQITVEYVNESYKPENLKKEVQEITLKHAAAQKALTEKEATAEEN